MEVQSFRSYIRCNKHTDRRFRPTKVFYDFLLLSITHSTGNLLDCGGRNGQILTKMLCEIFHSFNALSKDHKTIICRMAVPSIFGTSQQFKELLISGKVLRLDSLKSVAQRFQLADILDISKTILLVQLRKSGVNALNAGSRAGEQGFLQTCLKQMAAATLTTDIHLQFHI